MTRLVTAILARNEAAPDRYLRRVLARCKEFSDAILVLDDGSTDDTVAVCESAGAIVKRRPVAQPAWGAESSARAELWERGTKLAKDGWLLIADADMILNGDPRPYCETWEHNAWAFPLFDLWDSEGTFRVDGPWAGGPTQPRPWLFCPSRVPKDWRPIWNTRGIHTGHCPPNFPLALGVTSVLNFGHLAYLRKEHRVAKHAQYLAVADQLSDFERAHAMSVND